MQQVKRVHVVLHMDPLHKSGHIFSSSIRKLGCDKKKRLGKVSVLQDVCLG